jgi:hypothetical protein
MKRKTDALLFPIKLISYTSVTFLAVYALLLDLLQPVADLSRLLRCTDFCGYYSYNVIIFITFTMFVANSAGIIAKSVL